MFDYRKWCASQAEDLRKAIALAARSGVFDKAVYFIPAKGAEAGRLILAHECPAGATDVIRFRGVGSRVSSIPYAGLSMAIEDACQRLPLIPTEGV